MEKRILIDEEDVSLICKYLGRISEEDTERWAGGTQVYYGIEEVQKLIKQLQK